MAPTSAESPIRVAFVPGHVTGLPGRIGMTLAPGKRDGNWQRDLDLDLGRLREVFHTDLLVSLIEAEERNMLGLKALPERARAHGLELAELPIEDGQVPESRADLDAMVLRMLDAAATGRNVVAHCRGGLGRAGTLVAACLCARGAPAEAAMQTVRRVRPGAIETAEQEALIHALATGAAPALPVSFARFRGCLLGGAIGDALGYPIEFDSHASIIARWGQTPPDPLAYADTAPAVVSDDTQMTLFTGEGLIAAPASPVEGIRRAYLRWFATQVDVEMPPGGWLSGVPRLNARRAPGNTCLSALHAQRGAPEHPTVSTPPNDSKGCGAIMRSAPIGLGAASREQAFALGRDAGVLTHGHPSGYLSAAYFAALIHDLSRERPLEGAMQAADVLLAAEAGAEETQRFIALAREVARGGSPSAAALEGLGGGGWTGESALAIALACVLAPDPTFAATLWRAVAHGGDSDSTGSLVGNLLGAARGDAELPPRWLAELELREEIETIASDLYDRAVLGARMDADKYG